MNKFIVVLVVLVIVAAGAYFLVFNKGPSETPTYTPEVTPTETPTMSATPTISPTSSATATPTSRTTPSKTPAPATVTVNIRNFAFSPTTLTIKKGTRVTWVNNDTASHTVTSDSGSLLNSPTLAPGQSYSVTFSATGTSGYHCAIHPMMKGSVVVTN